MQTNVKNRVKFVRWPAESDVREQCKAGEHPCLLIVEHGAPPPEALSPHEDWVRPPIVEEDLHARVRQLTARAALHERPVLDPTGMLHYRGASVALTLTQHDILVPLVSRYGQLVQRSECRDILERSTGSSSNNALDLQIMRLRGRLELVGLAVRNIWGRGFVVEPV